MNKLYRENINKQICEKRADVELIETLREWSVAKSNFDSESCRKRESSYMTNKLHRNHVFPQNISNDRSKLVGYSKSPLSSHRQRKLQLEVERCKMLDLGN